MSQRRTFRNFTHRAWAIWDLSNHDLFHIIPDPGSQKWVTLSLESICTIPLQAMASDVKIPKLRQYSSNCRMPSSVNLFGIFRGTWDRPDMNPGALLWCVADIVSYVTHCEIHWPGMLVARKIGEVSVVGCTNDWYNRPSGRQLILCIPLLISRIYLAVDSKMLRVGEAQWFKIKLRLKCEMWQKKLDTFDNIPIV